MPNILGQVSPSFIRRSFQGVAERGGFEPPVELLTLRRFSKPLLSTTQPPLRRILWSCLLIVSQRSYRTADLTPRQELVQEGRLDRPIAKHTRAFASKASRSEHSAQAGRVGRPPVARHHLA